jgi:hypothetical protein
MSLTPSRHRRKPAGKGSGAPGIENAAVERRKASWPQGWHVLLRRSTLKKLRHYGAPLPLLREQTKRAPRFAERQRKENLTLARKSRSENENTWLFENVDLAKTTALDPSP